MVRAGLRPDSGGVPEWPIGTALKAVAGRDVSRGFESRPLCRAESDAEGVIAVTDAVTRYRGVPAAAVLAFGGVALLAGGCVVALVVTDRWRDDSTAVAVVFWALV